MISVLRDSYDCVGFLRSAGPRGFQAYDDASRSVALSILMTLVARGTMQKNLDGIRAALSIDTKFMVKKIGTQNKCDGG
jgi:hypothetical protein